MIFIDRKYSGLNPDIYDEILDPDRHFYWLKENIQGQFEYVEFIVKDDEMYDRWRFEKHQDALAFKLCFGGELVCEIEE